MTDEQKARAASELREVDVEFENASLAMMRAFEAFQRYEGVLEDAEVDRMPPEGREYEEKHDVACSLHYVLRCIATEPTGKAAAVAVAAALDRTDIERVASDGKLHPPRRRATIAGLTHLIDERERQIEGLVERHVENDPQLNIETALTGITAALRQVRREREVLIHARDIV